jgi:capsular exopolysaccharide synthesis family protein
VNAPRSQLPPDEQHLIEHLDFLRRRWGVVAAVFLGFVGVAAAIAWQIAPTYQATARILVGGSGSINPLADRASSVEGYLLEGRSFETQLEIMRSEPVAERAALRLGLLEENADPAHRVAVVSAIKAAVEVTRVRDTRIVLLRADGPDPESAEKLANGMADAYIAYAEEQRDAARKRSIEWLTSETGRARESLKTSEERLVDYISSEKIDFSADQDAVVAPADAGGEALRSQIAAAEMELSQLRRRYRDLHPKVQEAKARLDGLRQRLVDAQGERATEHRKLIQYRILKRDVDLDHELYQVLLKKLKEADLEAGVAETDIRVLESAKRPRAPIGPHAVRTVAIAAVLGLCLGLGAAYAAETLDRTARSADDVQRALGLPTLGVVERFAGSGDERSLAAEASGSIAGETFRALRTNVRFSHVDRPRRVVLVTSTGPEEGKSTVLANLAVSLAQSGRRTLVIDTDLRRPSLHRFFQMGNQRGLADVLAGDAELEQTVRPSHIEGLDVLPSGTRPPNPAELIESNRLQELVAGLRQHYDYLLLDSPPAGGLIDSSLMCGLADGVLFVVERGRFDLKLVSAALRQLDRAGAKLYGVVLNKAPAEGALYGYYHYGAAEGASPVGAA